MRKPGLTVSILLAWAMVLGYDRINVMIGVEFKPLLYAAMVMMVYVLYLACQGNKQTEMEEA